MLFKRIARHSSEGGGGGLEGMHRKTHRGNKYRRGKLINLQTKVRLLRSGKEKEQIGEEGRERGKGGKKKGEV